MLLRAGVTYVADFSAGWLAIQIKQRLRSQFFEHITRLGPAFTQGQRSGELINSAVQGIEALDAYFSQFIPQLILAAVIPTSILLVVFPADGLSGLVMLLTAPLIPIFMVLIGKGSELITRRQWSALTRLGNYFLDSIQGLRELKQLGQSAVRAERVAEAAERYRLTTMQVLRITFLSALALEFLSTLSTAVIAVEIGLRLLYAKMTFHEAFFILLLAPEFYLPLRLLGQRFHAGMNGITAAKDIYKVLEVPIPNQALNSSTVRGPDTLAPVRFEKVSFTYPTRSLPAVEQVSFVLRPGERTALVGDSGAGKSTIAQLLMGFSSPDSGAIYFGDTLLQHMDASIWRQWITWVPQQPFIFNDTLRNNILLGKQHASAAEITAALERSYLDQVVAQLPQGLDTALGEGGARLSGGQVQRVALARAFLVNSPIVVLDEPTAHLDPELERLLDSAVEELCRERTVLTIAHRLNTVVHADQILVIQAGRIVESGQHPALIRQNGVYAALTQAYSGRVA